MVGRQFAVIIRYADGLRYPSRVERDNWEDFCSCAPYDDAVLTQEFLAQKINPDEKERVLQLADQYVRKEFKLLGGEVNYGHDDINWHYDFKSRYEWDVRLHYTRIPIYADHPGADIKIPWELSRGHHFVTLGLAYRLTGDIKFYEAYRDQISSWIAANPVSFGVNWACSMEVAIRAVNWLTAGLLFQNRMKSEKENTFLSQWLKSLWHHGIHLSRNPEWRGVTHSRGNHFIADLTGLFALGFLFQNCRTGANWLSMIRPLLEDEIQYQVLDDGTHHERSTTYHRMVYEMFLYCERLCSGSEYALSPAYLRRLTGMEDFLLSLRAVGSERIPRIGDTDDGNLLNPLDEEADSLTGMFPPIAGSGTASIKRFLLAGEWDASSPRESASRAYPDGGFYVMKTDECCAVIRAGALGEQSGHAHCDQLSFTLNVMGRDFFVDRGSGVYSADIPLRNYFRGTASHNTVRINNGEQNFFRLDRKGLFSIQERTCTHVLHWKSQTDTIEFTGEHYGYQHGSTPVVHRRKIIYRPLSRIFQVIDQLIPRGENIRAEWFFHLAPDVQLAELEDHKFQLRTGDVPMVFSCPKELSVEVIDVWHSSGYDQQEKARCIICSITSAEIVSRAGLCFELSWSSISDQDLSFDDGTSLQNKDVNCE